MLFKIRDSFALHLHKVTVLRGQNGKEQKQTKVEPHFASEVVELDEKEARTHFAKLEPADDEAQRLFDGWNAEKAAHRNARQSLQTLAPSDVNEMIRVQLEKALAARDSADKGKSKGTA
jgi:hypothetical protein